MPTGREPLVNGSRLIVRDELENFRPFGSLLAKKRPLHNVPEFVHIPEIISNNGSFISGEGAGFLGDAWDSLVSGDPSAPKYGIPGLSCRTESSQQRVVSPSKLQRLADRSTARPTTGLSPDWIRITQKAVGLPSINTILDAFNCSRESAAPWERYGLPDREDCSVGARSFGGLPYLSQCLLLSRRSIESGVRLVTCMMGRRYDQTRDGYRQRFFSGARGHV